jgi:hypothetical protein
VIGLSWLTKVWGRPFGGNAASDPGWLGTVAISIWGWVMAKLVIWVVLFLAAAGPAFAQATSPTPPAATSPTSASPPSDQFKTLDAAKSHCPGDTVVWATLTRTKVYHLSGDRYYGKTRRGAYMCQKDAVKDGMHQAGRRSTTSTKSSTSTQ